MKLCVFGNSHAAALKHGWDIVASEYPDIDLQIFSIKGQGMAEMELAGNILTHSQTSSKKLHSFPPIAGNTIDLASYDGFILYGLGLKIIPMPDGAYSRACQECAIIDAAKVTALWKVLCDIRTVSDAKTIVGHSPLSAAPEVDSHGPSAAFGFHLDVVQERGLNDLSATIVAQPDDTIVNGCMSDPKYLTDALRLNRDGFGGKVGQLSDRSHMNADFGAEMMRTFLGEFSPA